MQFLTIYNLKAQIYIPWANDCGRQADKIDDIISWTLKPKFWKNEVTMRWRRPGGPDSFANKFVGNHTVIQLTLKNEYSEYQDEVPIYIIDPWIDPMESIKSLYGDPLEARRVDLMLYEDFEREYPYGYDNDPKLQ